MVEIVHSPDKRHAGQPAEVLRSDEDSFVLQCLKGQSQRVSSNHADVGWHVEQNGLLCQAWTTRAVHVFVDQLLEPVTAQAPMVLDEDEKNGGRPEARILRLQVLHAAQEAN